MRFTIGYITGRWDPHLEHFVESLAPQLAADDHVELIVVDGKFLGRQVADRPIAVGRWHLSKQFSVIITPPKPTIWQGPDRLTQEDWWAMSNARNTVFVRAVTDWVACVDDRCIVGPRWMEALRDAVSGGYVVCGGYEKRHGMFAGAAAATGDYDRIASQQGTCEGTRVALDNRYEHVGSPGHVGCPGQWLYGCSFALPLAWALETNGFEEGCDGQSAEDYIFGLQLANAGRPLTYDPRMWVIQDRSPGQENAYRREDKGVSPHDKSHAALARFGTVPISQHTRSLLMERQYFFEMGQYMPLAPGPRRDWYDGELIDHDYPRDRAAARCPRPCDACGHHHLAPVDNFVDAQLGVSARTYIVACYCGCTFGDRVG